MDINHKRKKSIRRDPKSEDPYIRLLVKVRDEAGGRRGEDGKTAGEYDYGEPQADLSSIWFSPAVQVPLSPCELSIQQSGSEAAVHEQDQPAPHLHSQSGQCLLQCAVGHDSPPPPLLLCLLPLQVRQMRSPDRREKIAVVVGTVTNDVRILELPKLKVCMRTGMR